MSSNTPASGIKTTPITSASDLLKSKHKKSLCIISGGAECSDAEAAALRAYQSAGKVACRSYRSRFYAEMVEHIGHAVSVKYENGGTLVGQHFAGVPVFSGEQKVIFVFREYGVFACKS